jgi:hypothetical protein
MGTNAFGAQADSGGALTLGGGSISTAGQGAHCQLVVIHGSQVGGHGPPRKPLEASHAKHFMGLDLGTFPVDANPTPDDGSNDRLFRAILQPSFDLRGLWARLREKSVGVRRPPRVALP